jgi:hypothetical protein
MIMKALAIFLSIYILILTGIPCADVNVNPSSQKTELSQASSSDTPTDIDCCSPFCTCQCCQACFHITDHSPQFIVTGSGISYHENKIIFESADIFDFLIPPKA